MKTSFDISQPLLLEVKALAKQRGVTTRSLVEQALIKLIEEARQPTTFRLRDVSFGSGGLTPEFEHASWDRIRDAIYPVWPGKNE
jgi:non-ribosomal peptide synthetase component F